MVLGCEEEFGSDISHFPILCQCNVPAVVKTEEISMCLRFLQERLLLFAGLWLTISISGGCRTELASISMNSDQPYPTFEFRASPREAMVDQSEPPDGSSRNQKPARKVEEM